MCFIFVIHVDAALVARPERFSTVSKCGRGKRKNVEKKKMCDVYVKMLHYSVIIVTSEDRGRMFTNSTGLRANAGESVAYSYLLRMLESASCRALYLFSSSTSNGIEVQAVA